jgi:hypothetical protein
MNKILLWTNLTLKALDVATTAYLVHLYGAVAEGNPIVRGMFSAYGIWPAFIVAFSIFGMLMAVLYKFQQKKLLILSAAFMLVVVVNNTLGIFGWAL